MKKIYINYSIKYFISLIIKCLQYFIYTFLFGKLLSHIYFQKMNNTKIYSLFYVTIKNSFNKRVYILYF